MQSKRIRKRVVLTAVNVKSMSGKAPRKLRCDALGDPHRGQGVQVSTRYLFSGFQFSIVKVMNSNANIILRETRRNPSSDTARLSSLTRKVTAFYQYRENCEGDRSTDVCLAS